MPDDARTEAARPLPPWAPAVVRPTRGVRSPRAIRWYGFTAFWGHLRHLVASAIATDNIDSRQWMIPEAPDKVLARAVDVLAARGARRGAPSLAEAMGGEVWIDFVADTGDDVTVSEVVARLVAGTYEVSDPDDAAARLVLPRGDVLFLGGDLAYPVATVREITRRLVEPWNAVFGDGAHEPPRVLLGVPGNHDWYDGLDGFARLLQAPCAFEDRGPVDRALHPDPDDHPVLAWAEAFARGDAVTKPSALALAGYLPVQRSSYFRLPLGPGLDLFAVDRQLKRIDPRQAAFFAMPSARARFVVVPDPARAWGEVRLHGEATLDALGIEPATHPTLLLAGDIHHYERSHEGPSVHVVAGGGGAFLHGARVAKGATYPIEVEFPDRRTSRALLAELPKHCTLGRAGLLLPMAFALGDAVALAAALEKGPAAGIPAALVLAAVVAVGTALLVGLRQHRAARVVPFATVLGLAIGALPVGLGVLADGMTRRALTPLGAVSPWVAFAFALVLATFVSSFFFGAMLWLIALLGLNHAQPWAALGSPGFKHIVRLRVRAAGSRSQVDGFVIGVADPVGEPSPVLVDTFRWAP